MNCIDCIYSINERKQCFKANSEVRECNEYENKHLAFKKMIQEMLED